MEEKLMEILNDLRPDVEFERDEIDRRWRSGFF